MAAPDPETWWRPLECKICSQRFAHAGHADHIPKNLACGHSYCLDCLVGLVTESGITCPDCDRRCELPPGGVQGLATNAALVRMVHMMVTCAQCQSSPVATSACEHCNKRFCGAACLDMHVDITHERPTIDTTYIRPTLEGINRLVALAQEARVKLPAFDNKINEMCASCNQYVSDSRAQLQATNDADELRQIEDRALRTNTSLRQMAETYHRLTNHLAELQADDFDFE